MSNATDQAHWVMQSPPGAEAVINGRRYLYFAGTAYLALQGHPRIADAVCDAVRLYGVAAATSRGGFGHQPPTLEAEAAAAEFFARPAAFHLASGYLGPAVLLAALTGQFDAAVVDEHSHYAIRDAVGQHDLPCVTFRHRDTADLKVKLAGLSGGQRPLVISDGVFAATGRIARVDQYIKVLRSHPGSGLMLDDAHGAGVLGECGRGTFEHFGIAAHEVNCGDETAIGPPRFFSCATLSKALGTYGGIICGDAAFISNLKSTSHIYSGCSAVPTPLAAGAAAALRLLMSDPTPRRRLLRNTMRMQLRLRELHLPIDDDPTPVFSLDLGDGRLMQQVQAKMMDQGIAIAFMSYAGTGPVGALRIAVSAAHEDAMIDHLAAKLRESL